MVETIHEQNRSENNKVEGRPLLVFMTKYGQLGASSRVRTYQNLWAFEDRGIETRVEPLFGDEYVRSIGVSGGSSRLAAPSFLNRIKVLRKLKQNGTRKVAFWIEKELFPYLPAGFESWLIGNTPFILDYDDAIFHNYDLSKKALVRLSLATKIDALMSRSQIVVCGNEYLAERARQAGASQVTIQPSTVCFGRYRNFDRSSKETPDSGPVRIVWIGSPTTSRYLSIVKEPLERIARESQIKLVVIGGRPPTSISVETEEVPWTENTEVPVLATCDIGIMPLLDSPWERGKCGYKLIQYMGCGLPVVASDVGVNSQIVTTTGGGVLVRNGEDWYRALSSLVTSRSMRRKLGAQGRQGVASHYSSEVVAPKLAELCTSMLRKRFCTD